MSYIRIKEGLRLRQRFGASFGRSGGSYIRIGENLYASGEEGLISSYVDSPIFESAEDIIYESSPTDYLEEIPLDTIEISTELSPLLTTATAATATTSAALPGSTAIISGITIAGVAIASGLGIGLTVPGRPNTGPGNEEETPTSNSDRISADHDSAYSNSKTQEDVRQADDIFLHEQFNELAEGDTINAALGIAGIGTKRVIESAIGVQYPPNLPTSTPGKQCPLGINGDGILVIGQINVLIGMNSLVVKNHILLNNIIKPVQHVANLLSIIHSLKMVLLSDLMMTAQKLSLLLPLVAQKSIPSLALPLPLREIRAL